MQPPTGSGEPSCEGPHAGQRTAELAQLEAVLFLGREPISSRKIAELAGLANGPEARKLIHRLNRMYDAGGSPVRVEELAGGYQLLTRPKFGAWLRRLLHNPVETRLSAPAMETLAVVAYRQPVLRTEIESVRGVQCGDILRQLMERDLVRIVGRSDDLGRPLLYGTTKRFLAMFGLRHLDELPRAAEFRSERGTPPVDRNSEDEAVTTRIRPATDRDEELKEPLMALAEAARRQANAKPVAAADEDEDEEDDLDEDEDEEWDDDEDDEDEDEDLDDEDDDFVDEEWEEVDDEEPDEDDEDDEDDEEWDDEEEDEEDWDEDDEDEDDDEEWEEGDE